MIESVANPTIRRVRRLRKRLWRDRSGDFLAEGHRTVAAGLDAGRIRAILHTARASRSRAGLLAAGADAAVRVHAVSDEVMAYLTSGNRAPDVLGVAVRRDAGLEVLDEGGPAVVLCSVRDPAAAGGLIALAAATGCRVIVAPPATADVYGPRAVRAANGGHFALGIVPASVADAAKRARAAGARVVALGAGGRPPWEADLSGSIMLLAGEPPADLEPDDLVSPPAGPVEPSMVASAAAVLYEWVRRSV